MFTLKKTIIISSIIALTMVVNFSIANENSLVKPSAAQGSFKLVMQGLLVDTHQLTEAILMEDYTRIEKVAKNIANHPKPSMETRMKLMKAMGSNMAKFKANDSVVHDAAVNMMNNAQKKNIQIIATDFKTMIDGCVNCHSEFRMKVSAILK